MSFNSFINTATTLARLPQAVLLVLAATMGGLVTAYVAQFAFDYQPCELCLWQRIPYYASLVLCLLILRSGRQLLLPVWLLLLALVWFTSAGLAFYHVGVEQHWWAHGGACGGSGQAALTAETLLATPAVRCDEIGWSFLGLSMATWNVVFSLALVSLIVFSYGSNYGKNHDKK